MTSIIAEIMRMLCHDAIYTEEAIQPFKMDFQQSLKNIFWTTNLREEHFTRLLLLLGSENALSYLRVQPCISGVRNP